MSILPGNCPARLVVQTVYQDGDSQDPCIHDQYPVYPEPGTHSEHQSFSGKL